MIRVTDAKIRWSERHDDYVAVTLSVAPDQWPDVKKGNAVICWEDLESEPARKPHTCNKMDVGGAVEYEIRYLDDPRGWWLYQKARGGAWSWACPAYHCPFCGKEME